MTTNRKNVVSYIAQIMDEREKSYGSSEQNFGNLAEVWTWYLRARGFIGADVALMPTDATTMCTLGKIARRVSDDGRHVVDSFMDGAGYEICGAELASGGNVTQNETPKA